MTEIFNIMAMASDGELPEIHFQTKPGNLEKVKSTKNNTELSKLFLSKSVPRGAVEMVEKLLMPSADVNRQDRLGKTPLHNAASIGYTKALKLLLAYDAIKNLQNSNDLIPLLKVCKAIVRSQEKKNLLRKNCQDIKRTLGIKDLLLNPNKIGCPGKTPPHSVSSVECAEEVSRLPMGCSNANAQDLSGDALVQNFNSLTPLCENVEGFNFLPESGANVNLKCTNGITPLHNAGSEGSVLLVDRKLSHGDNVNAQGGPSHEACAQVRQRNESMEVVDLLLGSIANANRQDSTGKTPLHCVLSEFSVLLVDRLLSRGANVNVQDNSGMTPTHMACVLRHISVLKALLKYDVNVNLQDYKGMTPLHIVCWRRKRKELADLLLGSNANPNSRDSKGRTPLHYASFKGDVLLVDSLLSYGANVNAQDSSGMTPAHFACAPKQFSVLKALLKYNANVNQQNSEGLTPLHMACRKASSVETVGLLLESNANPNSRDSKGRTPLHYASLGDVVMVEKLLKRGADVNAQERFGNTPIHMACDLFISLVIFKRQPNLHVVNVLLYEGCARVDVKNNFGKTPYDLCSSDEYQGISFIGFPIINAIEKYVVKLKTAGFTVDMSIKADSENINYQFECVREMEKMKVTKIHDSCSLYTVFSKLKYPWYLINSYISQKLAEVIYCADFLVNFPVYGYVLRKRFELAKKRLDIFEKAMLSFSSVHRKQIWSFGLPDLVKFEILKYLSNRDLQNFVESG